MGRGRTPVPHGAGNGPASADVASALLRGALGAVLVGHGTQKLLGWFGGGGIAATGAGMHRLGLRPGKGHAVAAGLVETGSGVALAAGLATPAAGAGAAVAMGVAAGTQASNGFFASRNGLEYPGVLAVIALALTLGGAGRLSLDAAADRVLDRPWMRVAGAIAVPVLVAGQLVRRTRALRADVRDAPA